MTKRQMIKELRKIRQSKGEVIVTMSGWHMAEYLGSFMSLDPCGRYHCVLSPNGATRRCDAFWERLHEAAVEAGGWIEPGEGDPTDIYFAWPLDPADIWGFEGFEVDEGGRKLLLCKDCFLQRLREAGHTMDLVDVMELPAYWFYDELGVLVEPILQHHAPGYCEACREVRHG